MKINKSMFLILIYCVFISLFNYCINAQKFEGEVIGQKSCTPTRFVEELPESKIELLSFLTWDNKEPIIPPTVIGGLDSLISRVWYTGIALRMGFSGPVICEFTITTEGNAANIKILKPIGAGCDEAVHEAIYKTKYIPAKKDGKNIDQLMRASFNFILIKKP